MLCWFKICVGEINNKHHEYQQILFEFFYGKLIMQFRGIDYSSQNLFV